jgi:two-component system LytT family response regulator
MKNTDNLLEENPFFVPPAKERTIFLSSTMTGDLQLLRLEHIGYFRYKSNSKLWEAVLCNLRTLTLKKHTNAEKILDYSSEFIQINQSCIINLYYLALIKGYRCLLFPPFDKTEELRMSKSFRKKFEERFLCL